MTQYTSNSGLQSPKGNRLGDIHSLINAIKNHNASNTASGIIANGTTAATATQLTSVINEVDTVSASSGVALPLSSGKPNTPYQFCVVINNGANTLTIYGFPGSADTINGTAGNTGVSLSSGTSSLYVSAKGGAWFSISGSGGGGSGVSSLNALTGALSIAAGSNITVTPSGSTITIAGTGGGSPGGSDTQIQYNNAGSFGGLSTMTKNTDGTVSILPPSVAVSGTTKTLALTDANSIQACTNAATQTITIPLNASVPFPIGTYIAFEMLGAGGVTATGAGGVTVNGNVAGSVSISLQDSSFYIRKTATDTWVGIGGNLGITALTGDVTASGVGSVAATIANAAVTPAKSSTAANTYATGITIDGGGSVITTGSKGFVQIPYSCTITNWTVLADQSGSTVIDVKRSTYSAFPTTASIVGGGNSPTLSSVQKNTAAPSGWTSVTLTAGDVLEFSVTSAATVTRVNLLLTLVKT